MVEFDRALEGEPTAAANVKICVVGIGGGGLNVLDRISFDRMLDANVVAMHTDVRVLMNSMSAEKLQLGADVMRGIGSGGDPELGREAAWSSRAKVKAVLEGHHMVFVCCGLGGGTGSGAAPVVARLAKETGALVFVFATMPFSFEGRRRLRQAELAMEELAVHADALILFENNRMGELVLPKEGIQKAFSQADQLIGHSLRAIATMVSQPGIVRMGLADLMTALNSPNARCLFGFGEARGTNRVQDALKRALKSPLVNQGLLLKNARNLLVHVAGGESLTLSEVETLMKQLGKCVPENTHIMFGLAVDARMGDAISLTLISSLSAEEIAVNDVDDETQEAGNERNSSNHASAPEDSSQRQDELLLQQSAGENAAPSNVVTIRSKVTQEGTGLAPVQKTFTAPVRPEEPDLFGTPLKSASVVVPVIEPEPQALFTPASEPAVEEVKPQQPFIRINIPQSAPVEDVAEEILESPAETAVDVEAEPVFAETEEVVENLETVWEPVEPEAVHEPASEPEAVEVPEEVEAVAAAQEQTAQPETAAPSIFSVIDDDDDEYEEEAPVGHWTDKYTNAAPAQASPPPVSVPVVAEQGSPARQPALAATTPVPVAAFKQASFDLNQDESGRFKGTSKNIVEGEDLDVPTWMRLRQKARGK